MTGLAVPMMIAVALMSAGSGAVNYGESRRPMADEPRVIEVQIDYFSFIPHEITIAAGATVTWVNLDDAPHKVTSTDRTFKSRVLRTDDKFSFKFDEPGTYEYYCSIHPKMRGKVVVQ